MRKIPIYEYKCPTCEAKHSENRGMKDPEPEIKCEQCKGPMMRVFGLAAVTFSGDGFYSNDKKTQISMPGLQ